MIKSSLLALLFSGVILLSTNTLADAIRVKGDDTIENILRAQTGKMVSIRTKSGAELGGKVSLVGDTLTHLEELSGKEFYDAVIVNKNIEAVIIRTR